MTISVPVEALCVGSAVPFRGAEASAIAKEPVDGPVRIARMGLEGDEQADRRVHGGPDMAVHCYPLDHHDWWRRQLGGHDLLDEPGAFGSNVATVGLVETDVFLGQQLSIGSALLEISQPRQPCWKIEHRFGHKGMVVAIVQSRRCGWYMRVVEEGVARAGDQLVLNPPPETAPTVAEAFGALFGDRSDTTAAMLEDLSRNPVLPQKLRERAAAMLAAKD